MPLKEFLRNHRNFLVVGCLLAAFLLYSAGAGLWIGLGYDDVMNISFAWEPPLRELLIGLLSPMTALYRPTGAAVYRILFEIFGFNPLPYRILIYALLLLNMLLVYKLAASLSRSREVGALAALLFSFHGRLAPIYLNNGTLYDVLCATLSLATVLYYTRHREGGGYLNFRQIAAFIALFILSINAKEMAAAIPVLLLFYELLYHAHRRLQLIPVLLITMLSIGGAVAKTGYGSVMNANPPYLMSFTPARFFGNWQLLTSDLVYAAPPGITLPEMTALWLTILLILLIVRKRYLFFFAAFAFLMPLPVLFIPFRGFFVMYLPLAGWAGFAAGMVVEAFHFTWSRAGRGRPAVVAQVLLFGTVAFLLIWIPRHDSSSMRMPDDGGQAVISGTTGDILRLNEPLPWRAKVLFLHDRFPADAWGVSMICRMLYNDRNLAADRPTMMTRPPVVSDYDRVFDYEAGRLYVVRRQGEKSKSVNYPE